MFSFKLSYFFDTLKYIYIEIVWNDHKGEKMNSDKSLNSNFDLFIFISHHTSCVSKILCDNSGACISPLAILTAAFPNDVPYMADESMLSTPGIEATDYTLAEYLNYAEHMKACSDRLRKLGKNCIGRRTQIYKDIY